MPLDDAPSLTDRFPDDFLRLEERTRLREIQDPLIRSRTGERVRELYREWEQAREEAAREHRATRQEKVIEAYGEKTKNPPFSKDLTPRGAVKRDPWREAARQVDGEHQARLTRLDERFQAQIDTAISKARERDETKRDISRAGPDDPSAKRRARLERLRAEEAAARKRSGPEKDRGGYER